MKARVLFTPLTAILSALILYAAIAGIGASAGEPPITTTVTVPAPDPAPVEVRVQGKTAAQWHRVAARYRARARARWQPTAIYAIRLASRIFGVSGYDMRTVAYCESRLYPFAQNGRYKGLFQLGWSPFGLSPYDPVANALSTAATVRHDGGWRQWECKP